MTRGRFVHEMYIRYVHGMYIEFVYLGSRAELDFFGSGWMRGRCLKFGCFDRYPSRTGYISNPLPETRVERPPPIPIRSPAHLSRPSPRSKVAFREGAT